MNITSSKWLRLVDRATAPRLLIALFVLTFTFALSYWMLSKTYINHGIKGPEGEQIDLWNSIYFSVVTETTLGYGDFSPRGFSRLLIILQVVLGLLFAGIAIARITSSHGRTLRQVAYKAGGDWIETFTEPKSGQTWATHSVIFFDGDRLQYNGENFDSNGAFRGFFHGELIDGDGVHYRFTYTNRDSITDYFEQGFVNVLFSNAEDKKGRWKRHSSTAHDLGKNKSTVYEGVRASESEIEILHGTDLSARTELLKSYSTSSSTRE